MAMLQAWKPLMALSIFFLRLRETRVSADSKVPCYFIFGDSISDDGNNNNRITSAKADYSPYGVDFDSPRPTGRFTNGLNLMDFIAKFLGFEEYIPPFATARGEDILKGVNYASGAAGIRNESGTALGDVISLDKQLKNHKTTIESLISLLGSKESAESLLKKCIYTVNIGSNDYLNNYFMPIPYPTSHVYTTEQYANVLITQFSSQLKTLYNDGARKVAVFGLGYIGCTPYAIANFDTNGSSCVETIDDATELFDVRLKSLVIDLNANLSDAKFTYVDSTATTFTDSGLIEDAPCCKIPCGGIQCIPYSTPCTNRSAYLFWDGVHPTQVVYSKYALDAYNSTSVNVTYPYSISELAETDLEIDGDGEDDCFSFTCYLKKFMKHNKLFAV